MTIHKKGKERDYEKKRTIANIIVILVALMLLAIISVVAVKKSNQKRVLQNQIQSHLSLKNQSQKKV